MIDPKPTAGADKFGMLGRLRGDQAGNTLALAAAGIMALMGMIGGAVDMSRSYMVQSRLQQACDAGALSARKAMAGERLTEGEKAIGYRFFDFNFPANTLGSTLVSRTYSQPTNSQGTPQAIVNGTIIATVPSTIMRAFGTQGVDLTVRCSSKMEIQSADVAMVLDVTGSMGNAMRIRSNSTATETRMAALRKAVKAFYVALGPGRAGGDLSRGRIRYGFVPYNVAVNTGYMLAHAQMLDSWEYQSREFITVYGWRETGSESGVNYADWTPPTTPNAALNAATVFSNYSSWGTGVVGTGTGNVSYTRHDGTTVSLPRTISGATSSNCVNNNTYSTARQMVGVGRSLESESSSSSDVAPNHPETTRTREYTDNRIMRAVGLRYRWVSSACRLESAYGNASTRWTETRSGISTRPIAWTAYPGLPVYAPRTIDVSGLKGTMGSWNATITVPAMNYSGSGTTYTNVLLSGTTTGRSITIYSPRDATVEWRGCVEERNTSNTITSTTPIDTIPTGAFDLNTKLLANVSQAHTRWKPFIPSAVFSPTSGASFEDDSCPAPAIRLQEIGDYDNTPLVSNYPNLFRNTSANPVSNYFPFVSGGTNAWRNVATVRNYIDRMPYSGGTIHDGGFLWGLHMVSGEGMFAADNPDRWNGQIVSRNIVFMTDGKMEPPADYYSYPGYNRHDGRVAPKSSNQAALITVHNRRLRILCEAAKQQGITVWVVAITDGTPQDFNDLRSCASSSSNYKSAATSDELIQSFTTIAQSIGGLRISQ